MGDKITVAEFCTKYEITRHKLNYQFKLNNIEKDEDKKFDEEKMLELLQITNMPNEEIQHLNKEVILLKEKLELLNNQNQTDVEIQHLKEKIAHLDEKLNDQDTLIKAQDKRLFFTNTGVLVAIHIGLLAHPKTRELATHLLPYTAEFLSISNIEKTD